MIKTVLDTLQDRNRINKIATNSGRPFGMSIMVFCLLILQACTSSEGKLTEARALMQQGKFREAIQPLNQAIDADADNYEAFNSRGVAYYELKDYENALLDYEQAIQLKPDFYKPYYNRAKLKTARGETDAALKDYAEAIRRAPDSSDIYLDRGQLFANSGNLVSALSDFNQAIQRDAKNSLAYFNRGNIRFQQEEYPEALNDFTKTVQLDSKFGKAFNALGVTQVMMNQRENGCLSLKQAKQLGYSEAQAYLTEYCQ
ncbi:tetratricopeptide repeat protein [Larkinella humicola]|uniref:Tetratricopeptide repeat protein n=1 Tax=Larkinella humicola TaxID=2607654 RepID=A0A5N1J8S5_9BACT|nr:tetratricopeptide repeat protein [Larkinella humicola]KAA9349057.1 tetratricopeptide repeat protein [Larkinella humicola]